MELPAAPSQDSQATALPTVESTPPAQIVPSTQEPEMSASSGRSKLTSPTPVESSSMTPPPSSQIPAVNRPLRTPTPVTDQLTSPPPTHRRDRQAEAAFAEVSALDFTQEEINGASVDDLRSMVNDLNLALREARMTAAHFKLQYQMACVENSEAQNRNAVEMALVQREVEVLQEAAERNREADSPVQNVEELNANAAADAILINQLKRQCQVLQSEKEGLQESLTQFKRQMEHREGEISSLIEENHRLRGRIRKNRDHINALLDGSPASPSISLTATPVKPTPSHGHRTMGRDSTSGKAFEALLLADKMLSQEHAASVPSTPTRTQAPAPPKTTPGRYRFSHSRNAASMSSLPATPVRHRRPPGQSDIQNPAFFRSPNFDERDEERFIPAREPPAHSYQPGVIQRRESSNSTITASSEDEVTESKATQAATNMLRRTPGQTTPSRVTGAGSPLPRERSAATLSQTRLFGQVRKAGVPRNVDMERLKETEKRRISSVERDDEEVEVPIPLGSPTKKNRTIGRREGLSFGLFRSRGRE